MNTTVENGFYPYPPNLPISEAKYLLSKLRGQVIERHLAVQAAWVVAGYAASQLIGASEEVPTSLPLLATEDAEQVLEVHLSRLEFPARTALAALDWRLVLQLLLKIVGDWLSKK